MKIYNLIFIIFCLLGLTLNTFAQENKELEVDLIKFNGNGVLNLNDNKGGSDIAVTFKNRDNTDHPVTVKVQLIQKFSFGEDFNLDISSQFSGVIRAGTEKGFLLPTQFLAAQARALGFSQEKNIVLLLKVKDNKTKTVSKFEHTVSIGLEAVVNFRTFGDAIIVNIIATGGVAPQNHKYRIIATVLPSISRQEQRQETDAETAEFTFNFKVVPGEVYFLTVTVVDANGASEIFTSNILLN